MSIMLIAIIGTLIVFAIIGSILYFILKRSMNTGQVGPYILLGIVCIGTVSLLIRDYVYGLKSDLFMYFMLLIIGLISLRQIAARKSK